jgi:hypothetical protein
MSYYCQYFFCFFSQYFTLEAHFIPKNAPITGGYTNTFHNRAFFRDAHNNSKRAILHERSLKMPLELILTEQDHAEWEARRKKIDVDNHPLRDTSKESFFDAMLSEEADLTMHGFVSAEALATFGR